MTKSSSSSSSASGTGTTDRVQLAKAINVLVAKGDAWLKGADAMKASLEGVKEYTHEALTSYDQQIDAKRKACEEQRAELGHALKRHKMECDMQFEEHEAKAATKFLEAHGQEAVVTADLASLRADLQSAKDRYDSELAALHKTLASDHAKALGAALRTQALEHKADVAELAAQVKQKGSEVTTLQSEIANLRGEIAEQRKLTQAVAEASKAPPISQSFGK